jgi:hypothetical protein
MDASDACRGNDAQTRWIGRGGVIVLDHALNVSYADISAMLGLALVILWLRLRGRNLRDLLAQAALTLSGYFRPRPDRAMECALRNAFTQLDRELAAVLGDRPVPRPRLQPASDRPGPDRPAPD